MVITRGLASSESKGGKLSTMNLRITFLIFLTLWAAKGTSLSDDLSTRVDLLLRNWKSTTPETLRDPANADAIEALRREAIRSREPRSCTLLLRAGDPEFTSLRLSEFGNHPNDRGEDIAKSGNARLILLLAPALFQEENASIQKVPAGDEVSWITPLSVRAGAAIGEIIQNSSVFSPGVVAWAKELFKIGGTNLNGDRQQVRDWVTLNRQTLEAGEYGSVHPPS
jgi:hypothetical protein